MGEDKQRLSTLGSPESSNIREQDNSREDETSNLRCLTASSLARAKFLLVAFFIFSMPLAIYLPNTSYTYTKAIFALFMISFLLILWTAETIFHQNKGYTPRLRITPLFLPLLALVGVAALSMVNGQSLTVSLSSLAQLIYFVAFYLLLANTIEDLRQGVILLGCLLAAGSLIAVYALLQYYQVLPGPPGAGGSEVIISTLGNKNYVAEFLSFLFIPGFITLFQGRHFLSRFLSLAGLGLIIAVLFVAGSKGAWLALIISLVFFAIGLVGFRFAGVIRQSRRWLWPLLGLGLAGLLTFVGVQVSHLSSSPVSPPVSGSSVLDLDVVNSSKSGPIAQANNDNDGGPPSQGSSPEKQVRMQHSIQLRIWNWWSGWEMLKDHPLLGVGLGNYKLKFLSYKAKLLQAGWGKQRYGFYIPRSAQAHNEYVQIAAEMGGLGVLALAWVLWMLLRGIRRIRSSDPQTGFLYLSLSGGVIAFLADSGISFPLHRPASALVLTVLMGLLHAKGLSSRTGRPLTSTVPLTRRGIAVLVTSVLIVAMVVGVAVVAYRDFCANLYLEAGRLDLEQGRPLEAKEKLERSSRLAFQPATPLSYLGEMYWELGDYQRAVDCLERSLPGRVTESTYLLLAQAYAQLKDDEKAWGYLHQLLSTEPHPIQKVQAYYLRAQLFQRRGDLKMALAQLEHVIQQAMGLVQVKAYVLTAEIYLGQGDHESARAFYLQGLGVAETQLQQEKDMLKEQLTGQGVPFPQYAQLATEIDQLEKQVEQIQVALEALSSP